MGKFPVQTFPAPGDLRVEIVENTVINIVLVRLSPREWPNIVLVRLSPREWPNIVLVRLSPREWPKVGREAAK